MLRVLCVLCGGPSGAQVWLGEVERRMRASVRHQIEISMKVRAWPRACIGHTVFRQGVPPGLCLHGAAEP